MTRVGLCALAIAAGLLAPGCGGREYGWEKDGGTPKEKAGAGDAAALAKKADGAWARRDDPRALAEAIEGYKKALEAKGGADYALLVRLSRAHYVLGEISTGNEAKLAAYEAGMKYGDLALNTIPAFRERFQKEQAVEAAVEAVGKEGIDAIYWDAVNIGKWANVKGKVKVLFLKEKVKRMVERVAALDETWFYGASHRYLGAYFAALPTFAGRDLEASKKHFERAKAIGPSYFATRVLCAEYLAKATNDRKLYQGDLDFVLKTKPEVLPDVAPEQRIEQAKAKRMIEVIDDEFEAESAEPAPAAPPAGGSGKS